MALGRAVRIACLALALVCLLACSTEARGNLKVDHVFGSAGDLITVNRLSTTTATVTNVKTDRIAPTQSEFVISAPQLSVDSSYIQVESARDINIVAVSQVSLNTGANIRTESNTLQIRTASNDVLINTPQAATTFVSSTTSISGNGAEFSSGKGGLNVLTNGGTVDVLSPLSSITVTGGGAGDLRSSQDVTIYSANGKTSISGDTAGFYAKERFTAFASTTLTQQAADLKVRAADELVFSADRISADGKSTTISSTYQEVEITGPQVAVGGKTSLTVVGDGQGVSIRTANGSPTTVSSTTSVSVVADQSDGRVVFNSDVSVTSTGSSAITAKAKVIDLNGLTKVSFGTHSPASPTSLTASGLASLDSSSTTLIGASAAITTPLFRAATRTLSASGQTEILFSATKINHISSGNHNVQAATVLDVTGADASFTAIELGPNCGDVEFFANNGTISTAGLVMRGGAVSLTSSGLLSIQFAKDATFTTSTDASGILTIDGKALAMQTQPSSLATSITSTFGAIDYLLAGTITWDASSIKATVTPGTARVSGYNGLTVLSPGTITATASADLLINSGSLFKTSSTTLKLQSTATNTLLFGSGAVVIKATDQLDISGKRFVAQSIPSASNLDAVSFTGGQGSFTAATSFEFTAFRKDVSFAAGKSITVESANNNVEFEVTNGNIGYMTAATTFTSTAANTLLSGLNIRTASTNDTLIDSATVVGRVGDRGIASNSRANTLLSGNKVVLSSDEDLTATFDRDATISTFGAFTVTSGAGTSVASSAGPVSISAGQELTFTSGQNVRFSTGGISDSSLSFAVSQTTTITSTGAFSADVTQDSLQFRGSQVDVTSLDRISITGGSIA